MPETMTALVEALVRDRGGRQRDNYVDFRCPEHLDGNPSAYLDINSGRWACRRPDCAAHDGRPYTELAERLGIGLSAEPSERGNRMQFPAPAVVGPNLNPTTWLAQYCLLPLEFIASLPIEAAGANVVYGFGSLPVRKLRRAGSKQFWWEPRDAPNPPLWPLPEESMPETIWLFEGETDTVIGRWLDLPAHALTKGAGGTLTLDQAQGLRRRGVRQANIAFDADGAGREGARKLASVLASTDISATIVDLAVMGLVDPLVGRKDLRDAWLAIRRKLELRELLTAGTSRPVAQPSRRIWTADDLLNAEFSQPRWLVARLLPEGLGILAGRPKMGKSWLALQFAKEVGIGGSVLDRQCRQGRVVYFALEDPPRRLKDRMVALGWPRGADVTFYHSLADLGGTLEGLPTLIEAEKPALVIVDTLARAMPRDRRMADAGEVTPVLAPVQEAAVQNGTTILLIDHYRKPAPGLDSFAGADHLDEVMDSTAKVAIADFVMGLARVRGETGARLKLTGRDLPEELDLAIQHERKTGQWRLVGAGDDLELSQRRRKVLDALRALGGTANNSAIAAKADIAQTHTSTLLGNLVMLGKVEVLDRQGREKYFRLREEEGKA